MTSRITDYKIVTSGTAEGLHHAVTEAIRYGWQPLNAPNCNDGFTWFQAMVKYEVTP